MRIFITGASGHIGSAVVPELLGAGHQVTGLARSERAAASLRAAGAEVLRSDLDDLPGLRAAAAASDGVIHLAFKHDLAFSGDFEGAAKADLGAIEALGAGLEGSGKPLVGTSGTMQLASAIRGRAGTEDDVLESGRRVIAEHAVINLKSRGVRSSVVRLAPTVHSELDLQGFIPTLIAMAKKNGFAAYVGDGANCWPALHTLDAARIYRLALEAAPAGSRLHGAAEEGVRFRAIAEAIGRGLGLPARSITAEEAPAILGFLSAFASADNPTSDARTRRLLNWEPSHPGLLADLEEGHYFRSAAPK